MINLTLSNELVEQYAPGYSRVTVGVWGVTNELTEVNTVSSPYVIHGHEGRGNFSRLTQYSSLLVTFHFVRLLLVVCFVLTSPNPPLAAIKY